MEAIRKSEQAHYDNAMKAHRVLQREHELHLKRVKKENEEQVQLHENKKAERQAVLEAHEAEHERRMALYQRELTQHEEAVRKYNEMSAIKKLFSRAKPEPPPQIKGQFHQIDFPEIPEPVLTPEPDTPKLTIDPPHVFKVTTVEPKEDGSQTIVKTQWGDAMAPAGSYLLTDESGKQIIVQPDQFQREFKILT